MANSIEMSVTDWIKVPANPRQRDTSRRAKTASRKHLSKLQKTHAFVFAASKGGSILCKLDGHTRAYLWESGELSTPPDGKVTVNLVDVSGIKEAKEIYDMLDAQPSVKKPSDTIYGACRENGFKLNSHLMRSCAFATQLKIANSGKRFSGDIYKMVKEWKSHLIEVDSWALTSNYTVLISVMLVSAKVDGPVASEFWKILDKNEGSKTSAGYDGPALLHEVMAVRRAEGRTAGYENLIQICGQAWTAYQLFKSGSRRKSPSLRVDDFSEIVTNINQKVKA